MAIGLAPVAWAQSKRRSAAKREQRCDPVDSDR
jgi:hypothetical protein